MGWACEFLNRPDKRELLTECKAPRWRGFLLCAEGEGWIRLELRIEIWFEFPRIKNFQWVE